MIISTCRYEEGLRFFYVGPLPDQLNKTNFQKDHLKADAKVTAIKSILLALFNTQTVNENVFGFESILEIQNHMSTGNF